MNQVSKQVLQSREHESSFSLDTAQIKQRLFMVTLCISPIYNDTQSEYSVIQST